MNEERMNVNNVAEMERAIIEASQAYSLSGTPDHLRLFYMHPEDYKQLLMLHSWLVDSTTTPIKMAGMYLIPHVTLRGTGVIPLYTQTCVYAAYDAYLTTTGHTLQD